MDRLISKKELTSFCNRALIKCGMSENDADIVSNVLVTTDMWGVYTHGTKNLYGYIMKEKVGGVSFTERPEYVKKTRSIAVIDGKNAMGYISSEMAMNCACDIAEDNGIGMVFVKNSCHFGASGYYANIAASKGMIGCVLSNVDKKMTIPGAKGMVMGHNPFALAAPATIIPSIIIDISTSTVAALRVIRAKESGQTIPDTWISDKDGLPTIHPDRFPDEGALLPMGGHKGYGIAMFVEVLTSIMLSQPTSSSGNVYSWCFDLDKPNNICHSFVAINPALIDDSNSLAQRVDNYICELQNAPKSKGNDRIYVPGEIEWEKYAAAEADGIALPLDVVEELNKVSEELDIVLNFDK